MIERNHWNFLYFMHLRQLVVYFTYVIGFIDKLSANLCLGLALVQVESLGYNKL